MAIGESTREQPSEVTTETIIDSLSNYDKPELIKLMSILVKDNIKLQKKLDETETFLDEQNGLNPCSHCTELAQKLESNHERPTRWREDFAKLKEEKDELLDKLGRINGNSVDDTHKTTFVPSRHGIGYESDSPKDNERLLTERELNECRARATV